MEDRRLEHRQNYSGISLEEDTSDNFPDIVQCAVPKLRRFVSNSLQESCSIPSLNCATHSFSKSPLNAAANQNELEGAEESIGDFKVQKKDNLLPDLSQTDVYTSPIVVQAQQQVFEDPKIVVETHSANLHPRYCKHTSNDVCCWPLTSAATNLNFLAKSSGKGSIRYVILLLSILCMTATRSNDLSFNFTVICMTSNSSLNNDMSIHMKPRELSAIFAGGGIGAIAI